MPGIVTKKSNNAKIADSSSNKDKQEEVINLDEDHVVTLEDGTRLSTSKALKKTKTFDEITITDIQLTEKENKTVLLGTLTNTSNTEKGGYYVNIVLEDKEGTPMITLRTYIDKMAAGETAKLNTQSTLDYASAYDFKVEM